MGLLRWILILIGAVVVARFVWQIVRPSPQVARSPRPAPPPSPHEVLGLSPGASLPEIQRAYRRLAREYHPDRVDGMATELRDLAARRMAEINAAYEALTRNHPDA